MKSLILIVASLLTVSAAHDASAQVFVNPFVGTTLTSPSPNGSRSKIGYGVAFGNVGNIFGFESEVAYYPEVLDNSANALAKSRVFTFSGNTLIGPTLGRVKAYGAVGVGDLFLNVSSLSSIVVPNPTNISTNYFTINAGAGAMVFVTSHLGVRGDLRYYRAYGFNLTDLQASGLTLSHFDFWRASVGLAAKF